MYNVYHVYIEFSKSEKGRKEEKERKRKEEKEKSKTSCPKASNGQRFPCPASLYQPGSSIGKQGSGPYKRLSPVEWGEIP